ncbi:membrane protein [Faecalimicrobium dakarense]|uniref:membrane protein n=1 Tax=Faecalimicrobium dakarense TaxID=1301100 RepID=UPI0004B395D1|nr:membrane protein [[Clostridium] dakarense]
MDKIKDKKYLTIALSIVYIFSIIYFFINKEGGKSGTSIACLLGTIVLYIGSKKYNKLINDKLYNVLVLFILSSSLLGSCYRLYDKINHYDDFLHFWSGFINVSVAFSILNYFNKEELASKMSKFFIVIYLFTFSMGISSLCEITEFLLDVFGGLNTQSGGLTDTMVDMIDSLVGSMIMVPIVIRKIKKTKK